VRARETHPVHPGRTEQHAPGIGARGSRHTQLPGQSHLEGLVLLREATAYRLIGNSSVPVATMAAVLSQIVVLLRDNPRERLQVEAEGAEGTQVEADEI
jgi:hypothetical protein